MRTSSPSTSDHFGKAKPTNRSRSYIENLASDIARKLAFKPGNDLQAVVDRLGGRIEVHPWDNPEQSGSIEVRGKDDFTVFLSPYTGHFRDRFTIAHELGHYFLHSRLGQHPIRIAREGSNQAEWEANWFAAGFLMPGKEFSEKWKEVSGNLEALANIFDVSPQTVRVRARTLGLL